MLRLRRLSTTTARTVLASAVVVSAYPAIAPASQLRSDGVAQVRSVDGPALLTIRTTKHRTLKIRLFFVDVPRPGQCGAAETARALRRIVARAPQRLRYQLVPTPRGRLARDPDGRYPATLSYRFGERELGGDLIAADWGRPGEPTAGVARLGDEILVLGSDTAGRDAPGPLDPLDTPRPVRGVWALCGGLLHLPAGEPVPPTAPATWAVGEQGIASSVGPLALSPELAPGRTLTLGDLARTMPAEFTRWSEGCRVWLPSLQVRAWAYRNGPDCGDGVLSSIRTSGPGSARFARGGGVGDPASSLTAQFPLLLPDEYHDWPLYGPDRPQWAWQTNAFLDENQRVGGLGTFASPLPGR